MKSAIILDCGGVQYRRSVRVGDYMDRFSTSMSIVVQCRSEDLKVIRCEVSRFTRIAIKVSDV